MVSALFLIYNKERIFIMLPNDPIILLSVINTKLRDFYNSLDELCSDLECDKEQITSKLASVGYKYDQNRNQFI